MVECGTLYTGVYTGDYSITATTTCGGNWYSTGAIGPIRDRQKKNPFLLKPIDIELRIFFPDKPKPKIDSFKRTSVVTISRIGTTW